MSFHAKTLCLSKCHSVHQPPAIGPVAHLHTSLDFGPFPGEVCSKTPNLPRWRHRPQEGRPSHTTGHTYHVHGGSSCLA